MLTDEQVEAAVVLLKERGWEYDEEMAWDVRDAIEAAQAAAPTPTKADLAEQRRAKARELAQAEARMKRLAGWRWVKFGQPRVRRDRGHPTAG